MRYLLNGRAIFRILLAIAIVQAALLIAGIPGEPCHVDEAWMAEQAFHEARDGVARQELLTGMFGFEERILIRHKLLIFLGSLVIRFFGFTLYGLRMVSLLAGFGLLWMMHRYIREREPDPHTVFLFSFTILFAAPLMFRYVKHFRPEFLMTALGFAGFLLVLRALERKGVPAASLAGFMAGLAVLAHLNGIIFVFAGLGTFLVRKRWKDAAAFLTTALATSAIYLYDVAGNTALFRRQFFNEFVVEESDYRYLSSIMRLFREHQRYFRTPEIIGISILFCLSLPVAFRRIVREHGIFCVYSLFLAVSLAMVSKSVTTKYAIPVLPFMAIYTASTLSLWLRRDILIKKPYAFTLIFILALHLGYGLFSAGSGVFARKSCLISANITIASAMEEGTRVLAPGRFIFSQIDKFEIRGLHAARYIIINNEQREFNLTSLCEYASERGFDYIVLDSEYRNFGKIDPERIYPPVWGYEVIRTYPDDTVIMKRFDSENLPLRR